MMASPSLTDRAAIQQQQRHAGTDDVSEMVCRRGGSGKIFGQCDTDERLLWVDRSMDDRVTYKMS